MKANLYLPWKVVENWRGKLAIVDNRSNGQQEGNPGRVCNLPRGRNDRGVEIAWAICHAMNAKQDRTAIVANPPPKEEDDDAA